MKQIRTRRAVLAAAVLAYGTMGSIEWSSDTGPPQQLLPWRFHNFSILRRRREARGAVRRASCTLVRYYVARYTAATAEAWARSKGATETEIQIARSCIMPQLTALSATSLTKPSKDVTDLTVLSFGKNSGTRDRGRTRPLLRVPMEVVVSYVLIVVGWLGGAVNGAAITTQEFTSAERCEAARLALVEDAKARGLEDALRPICLQK